MTPGTFNFPKHKRGDTFDGFGFVVTSNGGNPVDFTGATIKIQFRTKPDSDVVMEWLTSDNSIVITGANNNIINMQPKTGLQMDIKAGTYRYDINVLFPTNITRTYVEGEMQIVDDYSR